MAEHQSWFERNPKKTLTVFLTVFVAAAMTITEYVFEKDLPPPPRIKRSIRLREHEPNLNEVNKPHLKALEKTQSAFIDNLPVREYRFRTDENGFILPAKVHDQPDLEMVFLGGSTTECYFVDEDSRFPYRAGALLSQRFNKKINAYNSAKRANNSMHSLDILLNKILPMHPGVVVLMDNINDVNILLLSAGQSYWSARGARSLIEVQELTLDRWGQLAGSIKASVFPGISYRLGLAFGNGSDEFAEERERLRTARREEREQRLLDEGGRKVSVNPNIDVDQYEANLIAFVNICKPRKIMPVLMTMFSRLAENPDATTRKSMRLMEDDWGIDYATYKRLFDGFNERIRRVARENNVLLIDLAAQVPQEPTYMFDIVHLNTDGSRLVADIIANTLAESAEFQARLGAPNYSNGH